MACESDLLIIGGGPAGLCAAIQASSEGLVTRVLDNGMILGGQAKESNAIENYPGFIHGVTGEKLMGSFVQQAERFNTKFICPVAVSKLFKDKESGRIIAQTEDYQEYESRAVMLCIGLSYRRLNATNLGQLMGKGIYYGAPPMLLPHDKACKIAIIGGANSAGQAAVKAAENKQAQVRLMIRKKITDQMSSYLIEKIRNLSNIMVCEGCEVTEVFGKDHLEGISFTEVSEDGTKLQSANVDYMFIFIGAVPRTFWLDGLIHLDDHRYILTGTDTPRKYGGRLPFETSMRGVFAAGDVRFGSTKRVAAACGEGAAALQNIHKFLAM